MRVMLVYMIFLGLCGCESRREARDQQRAAFLAGQQQAFAQQQALLQAAHPGVTVRGLVENPFVPWSEGLTMSKAIVAAHYTGFMNPTIVRVVRNGQVVQQFEGVDLLRGHDVPLQPGDVVDLAQ